MARETDFLDLYKDLGLHPGCGLVEFKQAYRRRLATLHPDRQVDGRPDAATAERLQRLTALYGAAMGFQRQHGRLPGAVRIRSAQTDASRFAAPRPMAADLPQQRSRWLLGLLVLAAAGWLLWDAEPMPPSPATHSEQRATVDAAPRVDAPVLHLELGMRTGAVRAIEGDPFIISDDRWDYGPSWIRFENDKVVDWYSSTLRPLKAIQQPRAAQNAQLPAVSE